jgi:iron(III) transport system permease protein
MRAFPARPAAVLAVVLLAMPVSLPLLTALAAWAAPASDVWLHQLQHVLPRVAVNTAVLLALVAAATGVLGTALGWLVAGYDFPGRQVLQLGTAAAIGGAGLCARGRIRRRARLLGQLQGGLRGAFGDGFRLPPSVHWVEPRSCSH